MRKRTGLLLLGSTLPSLTQPMYNLNITGTQLNVKYISLHLEQTIIPQIPFCPFLQLQKSTVLVKKKRWGKMSYYWYSNCIVVSKKVCIQAKQEFIQEISARST